MSAEEQTPLQRAVERRNRGLDPQLVWRGKDDGKSFEVQAPPLFIQEKVHPKALIDDLKRVAAEGKVQCIYIDPPYGIKFNSNFQWSTTDPLFVSSSRAIVSRSRK